jgi:hypothetical protein
MFLEALLWVLYRCLLLEGPEHAGDVAADRGHGRMVRGWRSLPITSA